MRQNKLKFANHPKRPVVHKPLSSVTVYKNIKMIKTFFAWGEEREFIPQSPARILHNPRPQRPLGQGKAASDEEVEQLLSVALHQPRNRAILLVLIRSGCRAGELADLRVGDLELGSASALVTGKGDKRRRIYFDQETVDAIKTWLQMRPDVDHDHVFISIRGHGPLNAQSVSQITRRLSKAAGLSRRLGAHSFRHRVGLKFARAHVAPRVTQHYLGHTNILITLSYYQDVDESDLRDAGQML